MFVWLFVFCHIFSFANSSNVETPYCNLDIQLLSITYTTCFGAEDGEIIVEPGGGIEPYSYLWSTGDTDNRIITGAGVYSVTISDAENCELIINNLEIQDFDPIAIEIIINKPATCAGIPDGEFSWNVAGGFAPYRFYVDGTQVQDNSIHVTNGIYQLIVEDATGCTRLTEVTIDLENNIEIEIEEIVPGLSCLDNQGASILISVTGGTSPYQVNWEDGTIGFQTNAPLIGNNFVTITDNSGCRVLDSVYIESLDSGITIDTIIIGQISCAWGEDGRIEIIIGEGLPPFAVNWSDESDSLIRTNLRAGKYEAGITDANGCKIELPAIIIEDPAPISYNLISISDPNCHNDNDGMIDLDVFGGTGSIKILWNGKVIDPDTMQWPAGIIQLIFEDENGCISTERFELHNPPELNIDLISRKDPSCGQNDGSVLVSGNGGTGPILYTWSNGQTGPELSNLEYGVYIITIEDANGCSEERMIELFGSDSLLIEAEVNASGCEDSSDGSFRLRLINPVGEKYILRINDELQNETYNIGSTVGGLFPGTYHIILESETGCSGETTIEIGIEPISELQLQENFTIQRGMSVMLSPQLEGIDPEEVLFNWTPSTGLSCTICMETQASPLVSTEYIVTVILPDGCTLQASTEIIVETDEILFIPTAFSPNNDGNNDFFTINTTGEVALIHGIWIYDRWGSLIFQVQNCEPDDFISDCRWDGRFQGRELPAQNFIVVVSIETIYGEKSVISSDFMLIR